MQIFNIFIRVCYTKFFVLIRDCFTKSLKFLSFQTQVDHATLEKLGEVRIPSNSFITNLDYQSGLPMHGVWFKIRVAPLSLSYFRVDQMSMRYS